MNSRTPCGFDIFIQQLMWLILFTQKAMFLITSATLVGHLHVSSRIEAQEQERTLPSSKERCDFSLWKAK